MYNTTLAVVLRTENYKDNDKMLTLFSMDYGKIDVLAKSCRKQGAKNSAFAEPFVCGNVQIYEKSGRCTLTQSEIKESYYELRQNIDSFAAASLLVSICDKCVMPDSPDRKLFALLVNCLHALNGGADHIDVAVFFCIRMLNILGQGLDLSTENAEKIDFNNGIAINSGDGIFFGKDFVSILKKMQLLSVKAISDTVFGLSNLFTKESELFITHALDMAQIHVQKTLSFMFKKI